jgi:hypothetical protein
LRKKGRILNNSSSAITFLFKAIGTSAEGKIRDKLIVLVVRCGQEATWELVRRSLIRS